MIQTQQKELHDTMIVILDWVLAEKHTELIPARARNVEEYLGKVRANIPKKVKAGNQAHIGGIMGGISMWIIGPIRKEKLEALIGRASQQILRIRGPELKKQQSRVG